MKIKHYNLLSIMTLIVLVIMALTVIGCGNSAEVQEAKTIRSLQNPVVIGKLPDGRTLMRINIYNINEHTHSVYFFTNSGEVSINHSVSQGKTTRNQVVVFLDGVPVSTNIINQ